MSRAVMAGIKAQMPDINIEEWQYKGKKSKRKPTRKSNHAASLLAFMEHSMKAGDSFKPSYVAGRLSIPPTAMKYLMQKLNDHSTELSMRATELGVEYHVKRSGKRNIASLTR